MHGYELMTRIDGRTRGLWRPNPGSICPTLASLRKESVVALAEPPDTRKGEKARRRYALTQKGRTALAQHGRLREAWDENLGRIRGLRR